MKKIWMLLRRHKKTVGIFCVFLLFGVITYMQEQIESTESAEEVVRGETTEEQQTFWYETQDGREEEITVEVSPRELSEEERDDLLEQAVREWEAQYLGENASENEVLYPLTLAESFCGGEVSAVYESSNPSLLDQEGKIYDEKLPREGALVKLQAEFSCGEKMRLESRWLNLIWPRQGSREWTQRQLRIQIQRLEADSRSSARFSLPSSVDGEAVHWSKPIESQWIYVILLGIAAAFCLEWQQREVQKRKEKERKKQLMLSYPQMVEQMSLLLGSGMTILGAWEKMLQTAERMTAKNAQRIYVEEMWITYREIQKGGGEREAYEHFGARIGLIPYRRFASILSQNLSKGTKDVRQLLAQEASEAMEQRKNYARRLGEEAGTKLLFPMLLMFVLILLVLLLPAMQSF